MKFDQFENDTPTISEKDLKELKELKEEVANLRKDLEECGKGISALIDALYTESGNLRDFSDAQTRALIQSALKTLQELPKEIRMDAQSVKLFKDISAIKAEGFSFSLQEDDRQRIEDLAKDMNIIAKHFWALIGVVCLFAFAIGVWFLRFAAESLGKWISG